MDIWHISANTVELCTSMSNHELNKYYNLQCDEITRLNDLLQMENIKKYTLLKFVDNYDVYICKYITFMGDTKASNCCT